MNILNAFRFSCAVNIQSRGVVGMCVNVAQAKDGFTLPRSFCSFLWRVLNVNVFAVWKLGLIATRGGWSTSESPDKQHHTTPPTPAVFGVLCSVNPSPQPRRGRLTSSWACGPGGGSKTGWWPGRSPGWAAAAGWRWAGSRAPVRWWTSLEKSKGHTAVWVGSADDENKVMPLWCGNKKVSVLPQVVIGKTAWENCDICI